MTLIKFEKNINCTNSVTCNNNILEIFEKKLNVLLHLEKDIDKVNGHISISHKQGNHLIFLFLYDKQGIHESHNTVSKKIETVENNKVIKFKGIKPNENDLKLWIDE